MADQLWLISLVICFFGCTTSENSSSKYKAKAEKYFRCVYEGCSGEIDQLVSENIIATYPIFETRLGTQALEGIETVKYFAQGFGQRWTNARLTVHEAIAEGNQVVLVWSFSATMQNSVNS